jgi:hypothetical protein
MLRWLGKDDKNIPDVSHWFACGKKKTTSSSSQATTTTRTTNPGNGGTTTTSPAAQGSAGAVSGDELANTGFSATGPLIGGGLLLILRRTCRND